jgi:hypothetical protein
VGRQRQARDAPWSCGNQPAYHSMINRRSVPALHRACLHLKKQPGKEPWRNSTPGTLENGHDSGLVQQVFRTPARMPAVSPPVSLVRRAAERKSLYAIMPKIGSEAGEGSFRYEAWSSRKNSGFTHPRPPTAQTTEAANRQALAFTRSDLTARAQTT